MFTTKQSDIFYNDQTKEMFVCKVSSISAQRCEGSEDIVYGALPIVYKINKNSNYQSLIYPKNLSTFTTDTTSDLYDLVPSNCYADGTNFAHVTKPLINYNKSSDRYSITFVGKYTATADGFGVLNYIFQYIDTDFYLLDSQIYVPKAKSTKTPPFTFSNGYLNSDLIIGGNKLRWNETAKPTEKAYSERVTDYNIKPTHIDHNNSLGFNLINYCPSFETDCLTGSNQYPFLWSGGYITHNPKYTAFDPAHDIRVDFRARSFNVPSMTAYRSIQSSNDATNPSRWIDIATTTDDVGGLSGAGSGFCVYFYENPYNGIVEPQGIGSTLGYVKADSVVSEINGETTSVDGLIINEKPYAENLGPPANSFLGIGFDIRGEYCTTLEGKEGWLSAGGGEGFWGHGDSGSFTNTTAPCSVGIRGNRNSFTRVLTCQSMSTVAASAVPMHENASNSDGSDVSFQDYRIDLTNKGTRVTVYNKLTSATDYNTILQFDLDSVKDDSGKPYSPWKGFYNQEAYTVYEYEYPTVGAGGDTRFGVGGTPVPTQRRRNNLSDMINYPDGMTPAQGLNAGLNVGLSFTASNYCSYFELSSFEVTGVKIGKPNKIPKEIDNTTTVEYLEESSANLRRDLVTIPTKDPVDITMLITRESLIERIDLCGNILPPVETEYEEKFTGVKRTRDDIPGPPAPPAEAPTVVVTTPSTECAGWFEPEYETEGNRGGSDRSLWILKWHRISNNQLQSNRFDDVPEVTINNRLYKIRFETVAGGVDPGHADDLVQVDYIRDVKDPQFNQKLMDLNITPYGWSNFIHYDLNDSNGPQLGNRAFADTWTKEAVWLNDEEATLIGACGGDEGEKDFPTPEPISKLGKCTVTTWDNIQTLLGDYKTNCETQPAEAVNKAIQYTTTHEDKTEIQKQIWGQLFGRVEYYSYDDLSYKESVRAQFPNGITFFRKWGARLWNNNISWGDCFVVRGNVLEDAMKVIQPGGHGAAMWHNDTEFAYKDHSSGIEYTNEKTWEWQKSQGIADSQNSNLGFTDHNPQSNVSE